MIETIALLFSLTGAIFIGRHEVRFFAFVFWIIGNILWITYSLIIFDMHILVLMSAYLISNLIGLHDTYDNRFVACDELINFINPKV
jgi:hypothetical protein